MKLYTLSQSNRYHIITYEAVYTLIKNKSIQLTVELHLIFLPKETGTHNCSYQLFWFVITRKLCEYDSDAHYVTPAFQGMLDL